MRISSVKNNLRILTNRLLESCILVLSNLHYLVVPSNFTVKKYFCRNSIISTSFMLTSLEPYGMYFLRQGSVIVKKQTQFGLQRVYQFYHWLFMFSADLQLHKIYCINFPSNKTASLMYFVLYQYFNEKNTLQIYFLCSGKD